MNLSEMTREELLALNENAISELVIIHGITLPRKHRTIDNYFKCIEQRWEDLQQSAAALSVYITLGVLMSGAMDN